MWNHPLRHFSVALAVTVAFAACGGKKSPTEPSPPPSCTFSTSRTSFDFTSGGGTDSVAVTTAAGCAWSASSDRGWLTITGGATGNGSGTVTIAVTPNTSEARTGTLTVAGQQLQVRQEGAAACNVTITPASASYGEHGGSGTIAVSTASGCPWTAVSSASWISISSGSSGAGPGAVAYSVAENNSSSARSGTIAVGGHVFTVTQSPEDIPACTYNLSKTSLAFAAAGGSDSVAVTTASHCAWTAASNQPWLSVTAGSSGTGNGTVSVSAGANGASSSRTATLLVAGVAVTAEQEGQAPPPPPPPPPPPCNVTIAPGSASFTHDGGAGTVNVSAPAGCQWAVSSGAPWVTITSGASGSGNGSVSYTVAATSDTAGRSTTLTIGGQAHTVTQSGAPAPCTVEIAPASRSFDHNGGNGTITVTAPAGCQWTASSGAGWVVISGAASGTGNGTISYAVTANSDQAARNTTVSVAGKTHTVTQSGAPTACTLDISPAEASYPKEGGNGTIAVTTPAQCQWSASSNAQWLTITSAQSGAGNATLAYSVAATNELTARTGVITVGSRTFTVTQAGDQALCLYSVSPVEFTPCMSVPFEMTAVITTQPGCTWTATPQAPWITVTDGTTGIGPGTVKFRVTDNYDDPRFGQIFVRWPTPTAGQNLRISQAGCRYAVTQTAFNFTVAGGAGHFDVLQQSDPISCGSATQDRCVWSAVADVNWITITTSMPHAGDDRVNFTVAANNGGPRTGTIRVRDKTIQVTQAGQ